MNEIIPGLWIGDLDDALAIHKTREFDLICVLESWLGRWVNMRIWQPLLGGTETGQVKQRSLNKVARFIEALLELDQKVLVFCGYGEERSVLAVAWYLVWSKRVKDLDAAYELIKLKRPQARDRRAWIEAKP